MAAADEGEARAQLATMLERLARGPHAALGVPPGSTHEDIRRAFLALTKEFHPARFGRMAAEIQRFANEVFLGIKAAHDTLKQATPATAVPIPMPTTEKRTTSPGMVALSAGRPSPSGTQPAPSRAPSPTPSRIAGPPAGPNATGSGPLAGAPHRVQSTKPLPLVSPPGAANQSGNTKPLPAPTLTPAAPVVARQAAKTPPLGIPTSGARQPAPRRASDFDDTETRQGMPQTFQPPASIRPGAPAGHVPAPAPSGRLDPSTTKPPAPSVAVALDLIATRQWDAARIALGALAAMSPDSRHVRALVAFAAGRQAQVEGRIDDARIELQRALQQDPDLAPAKAALAELFARRR